MYTADLVTPVDIKEYFEHLLHGDGDKYLTVLGISSLVFLTCVAWSSYSLPIMLPYSKLGKLAWWPDLFVSGNGRGLTGQNFIFWFRFIMGLELLVTQIWDLQCQKGDGVYNYFKYFSKWNWTISWVYLLTASYATWRYWYNNSNNNYNSIRINNKYYREYEVAPVPASIQWTWFLGTIAFHSEVWIVNLFYWSGFLLISDVRDDFMKYDLSNKIRGLHSHGVTALSLIIDMLLVKQPILFIHIFYPITFWLIWIAFGVYLQLGYPGEQYNQGIFGPLDWEGQNQYTNLGVYGSVIMAFGATVIGAIGYILMVMINNKSEGRGWFYNINDFLDEYGGGSSSSSSDSLFDDEENERLLTEKL